MTKEITIANLTKYKIKPKAVSSLCNKVLAKYCKKTHTSLSVAFVDKKFIKTLNKKAFRKNSLTDVISFEIGDNSEIAGDIYICLDVAKEQSIEFDVDFEEEIKRLIIHGVLHSLGMEHKFYDKRSQMIRVQEAILSGAKKLKVL